MTLWTTTGPPLEIPVRAPGLPINLWLRWEGILEALSDWNIVEGGNQDGDWKRSASIITGSSLEVGDTALAGQATGSLAQIRRSEQGPFDTDDWGVAFADWVQPLTAPVTGPASPEFGGQTAYRGKSFPVGASVTIDLLVVRAALLRATPQAPPTSGQRQFHDSVDSPGRGWQRLLGTP